MGKWRPAKGGAKKYLHEITASLAKKNRLESARKAAAVEFENGGTRICLEAAKAAFGLPPKTTVIY